MPDEPKLLAERSYTMGNVGAGARAVQGENISWVEGGTGLQDDRTLKQQFAALLERIDKDGALDEDTRELAKAKIEAVAEGLTEAQESPGRLRRALQDAQSWFSGTAPSVGHALGDILKGDAAQKTIETITEAGTKAALASFLGL